MTKVILALAAIVLCAAALSVPLYARRPVPEKWKLTATAVNLDETITLTFGVARRNAKQLDQAFWDVSLPESPKYGEHLKAAEMKALVAPTAESVRAVEAWLRSNGASHVAHSGHSDYLHATFTLRQAQKLLGVTFHNYRHVTSGQVVARALDAVSIPAHLSGVLEVIGGYGGFPVEGRAQKKQQPLKSPETSVTPALLYSVYNVSATTPVRSNIQSFFQAQAQYVEASDLTQFCKKYLPSGMNCEISKYIGPNPSGNPGDESSLDSQYIVSMGMGTTTWVWSYASTDFCGDLMQWSADVFNSTTKGTFPYVISMSYGAQVVPNICQGPDVDRLTQDVQMMGTMGISVIIASGDSGAGTSLDGLKLVLAPSFPATIPYCTSVGATTFIAGNSGEQEATTAFGSGGGFSWDFPAPAYQNTSIQSYFSTMADHLPFSFMYNAAGRGTPDVSTLGEGFNIIQGGMATAVDGTSCSTPTFAGMVSLLNNIRLQNGKTLGFLNPLLYQNPSAFTDITVGDNKRMLLGWDCSAGWDPVTGLGTPRFDALASIVRALNEREAHKRV